MWLLSQTARYLSSSLVSWYSAPAIDDQFLPGKVSLRKVATAVNVLQGLMDSSSSNLKWSISVPLALGKADRQYFCVSAQEIAGKLS